MKCAIRATLLALALSFAAGGVAANAQTLPDVVGETTVNLSGTPIDVPDPNDGSLWVPTAPQLTGLVTDQTDSLVGEGGDTVDYAASAGACVPSVSSDVGMCGPDDRDPPAKNMISASRTGASSSARITFLDKNRFRLTGWTLSDTARDSRSVMVCVGMANRYATNGGEEPCASSSAGYGSIAGIRDYTSGFPNLSTVWFFVCTYNTWNGPHCTSGAPVVNPYSP